MLNVFITIDTEIEDLCARPPDTEIWVYPANSDKSVFSTDIQRDIYGVTPNGEFGLCFQIDTLSRYGLRGVFFVDPFFALLSDLDALREIVGLVQEQGHEVQLHLHTEWLRKKSDPILQGRIGNNINEFSLEEQQILITWALEILHECNAEGICAFRAGNFGANFDTLRALARNGILYDTSYNIPYLSSPCDMQTDKLLLQPERICGVCEFPITSFRDRPGHYRHAQLCACSTWEMENALMQAWRNGWYSFVIVMHTFELMIRYPRQRNQSVRSLAKPDRFVVKRFERLCRFLAQNTGKFTTTGFSKLDPGVIPIVATQQSLKSDLFHTTQRFSEQLARRFL